MDIQHRLSGHGYFRDTMKKLLLNGKEITRKDAEALVAAIYGTARIADIFDGLESGKYGCASVAAGYLEYREIETITE